MPVNNFYNQPNPWTNNSAGYVNTPVGSLNQQTPRYFGFNNFQRFPGPPRQMIPLMRKRVKVQPIFIDTNEETDV